MRKRLYSWQGQRFLYLGLEAEPGLPLERQADGLFRRAAAELRVGGADARQYRAHPYPRAQQRRPQCRQPGALARADRPLPRRRLELCRAALLLLGRDVGLDLFAMATPVGDPPRRVTEYEPQENSSGICNGARWFLPA